MSDVNTLTPATEALAKAEARFPAVAVTLRHWDILRAGRAMPMRDEVEPRNLARALEYLFVAEEVAPGVARLRLAGQHLNRLLGMETRGMPLCALFAVAARDEISQAVRQVTQSGLRVLLPLKSEAGLGRPELEGMLALLPLGVNGRSPRVLGVLETRGPIGRSPRRITLAGPVSHLCPTAQAGRPGARPVLRVIEGGLA